MTQTSTLKAVAIGAGYFSQFHYDAWQRIPEVHLAALCDLDGELAKKQAASFGIPKHYTDFQEMLEKELPDFVDIITPPASHLGLVKAAANRGIHIICQKPLAPSLSEAEELVKYAEKRNVRLMVHENFRFQPWYREIKRILEERKVGGQILNMHFRMRMGDGWQPDAYLNRQPYFRTMPRLLIFETGVHFLDTFQFLAGEITQVYAQLRKFNAEIAGEDSGHVFLNFANGTSALYDASRYHENNFSNPRYTFGEFLVETDKGSIRLYPDGKLTVQPLGGKEGEHAYFHEDRGFCADCVYFTQQHFIQALLNDTLFETDGPSYLQTLRIQEAVYRSSAQNRPVTKNEF